MNGHQSKEISEDVTGLYFQDPFVAIVIDPVRTISAGKVNLGAFRTYPKVTSPSLIIKTLTMKAGHWIITVYSHHLNTRLVRYSIGRFVSLSQIAQYSNGI